MASQSADGHVYALINPCSPICNMQLNVLNDLAEAMKALDGKKNLGDHFLFHQAKPKLASFLGSKFTFGFGATIYLLEFVAGNSRLTCVGRDRMRAE